MIATNCFCYERKVEGRAENTQSSKGKKNANINVSLESV